MKKKRVTFTFDTETVERLQAESKRQHMAQARIVEQAILKELERLEKLEPIIG